MTSPSAPPPSSNAPAPEGLPRILRVLALAALEGGAAATFFQESFRNDWLVPFLAHNALEASRRAVLMVSIAAGMALPVAVAGVALAVRRALVPKVERWAVLCLPVLLLGVVPALFERAAWAGRDLTFLIATALLAVASIPVFEAWFRALGVEASKAPRESLGRLRYAPEAVLAAGCLAYVLYFGVLTVRVHHKLETSNLDLGLFENLFWNAEHGLQFYAATAHDPSTRYLGIHAEFFLYALLPLYALVPRAETLLWIQAAFLGFSAVPLYLFARRRLASAWQALALAFVWLLNPGVHGPNFYDFHFLTLSPFFVFWGAVFLDRRRWVPFWISVFFALSCREDVALGLSLIGAGLALSGYRPKTGLALSVIAFSYGAVVKLGVMQHFGGSTFVNVYEALLPAGTHTFGGVVETVVENPLYTLGVILTSEKLVYLLQVLVPVALLPLRRRELWFLLLPGFVVTILSTAPAITRIQFQYVSHFTPYVLIATALVLEHLRADRLRRYAYLAAVGLGSLVMTHQYGAIGRSTFDAGFQVLDLSWSPEDAGRLRDLTVLTRMIPPEATVAAGEHEGPYVTHRRDLFALKSGPQGAEYLLYGPRSLKWGGREPLAGALKLGTYGVVATSGEFVLLRRGAGTARNAEILARLH